MEKLGRQWLPATHTPTVRAPQARRPLRIRLGGSGLSVDDDRWRAGFDAVISLIAPRFKRRGTLANSEAFVLG